MIKQTQLGNIDEQPNFYHALDKYTHSETDLVLLHIYTHNNRYDSITIVTNCVNVSRRLLTGAYSPWAINQPNNLNGNQNCGALDSFNDYNLADEACSTSAQFICEISTSKNEFSNEL